MMGLMSTSYSFLMTFSARTGAKDLILCDGKMLPKMLKSRGLVPKPAATLAEAGKGKTS
jgi:hypothetical protein